MNNIKFINGSEMTILEGSSNSHNAPMMIFAVDVAKSDSDDISCISYYCSKCKTIFRVDNFGKGEYVSPELFHKCPNCKTRFKGWILNQ